MPLLIILLSLFAAPPIPTSRPASRPAVRPPTPEESQRLEEITEYLEFIRLEILRLSTPNPALGGAPEPMNDEARERVRLLNGEKAALEQERLLIRMHRPTVPMGLSAFVKWSNELPQHLNMLEIVYSQKNAELKHGYVLEWNKKRLELVQQRARNVRREIELVGKVPQLHKAPASQPSRDLRIGMTLAEVKATLGSEPFLVSQDTSSIMYRWSDEHLRIFCTFEHGKLTSFYRSPR